MVVNRSKIMGARGGGGGRGSSGRGGGSRALSPNMVTGYNEASRKVVKGLAQKFLATADKYESQVEAYMNGSNKKSDIAGYDKVIKANADFNKAYSKYYGEKYSTPSLDYGLAESFT